MINAIYISNQRKVKGWQKPNDFENNSQLPRTLTQVAGSGFVASSLLRPSGPASPFIIPHRCEFIQFTLQIKECQSKDRFSRHQGMVWDSLNKINNKKAFAVFCMKYI